MTLRRADIFMWFVHKIDVLKAKKNTSLGVVASRKAVMLFGTFFFIWFGQMASAAEVHIDSSSPMYHNSRYGFIIKWTPGTYSVFEADNGDGITVKDGHGLTMRVWGELAQDVFGLTKEEFFRRAHAEGVQYSKVNREKGWYIASGQQDGNVYYKKSFYTNVAVITMDITYPSERRKQYDVFVGDAVKSFKP